MHSSTGTQIVALSVALLSVTSYVEAGNVQLDYSVTDESRSCANPGELVTFTCMADEGVLAFTATQFSSDPITFLFSDQVAETMTRSVGASTFTANLTEVDGFVLTATLTVVASEEVTGTIGCTNNVNTQEANLCLTVPQLVVVPENQLVPFNLGENIIFRCEVEDGEVVWEVNNIQEDTPEFLTLDNIFVMDLPPMGRRERSELRVTVEEGDDHNNTLVRCIGMDAAANTDASDQVRIITFAAPETPRNLQMTLIRGEFLFLSWDPPSNLPPGVETTYDVTVVNPDNGIVYPGFPMNRVNTTFVEFEELETSCQLYEFMVTAENDAGSSNPPAMINETIPISPNVTSVSDSLMATVSFDGADILLSLTFNGAVTCSTTFGVESYNISLNGEIVMQILDQDSDPVMVTLRSNEISALQADLEYNITVTACNSLTCRQAEPITIVTTDVQSANVTFVDTDVLLSCELAEGSSALGCVFIFTLNETERFNVSRSDTVGSLQKRQMNTQAEVCQTTLRMPDAYDSVEVVDWESDGSEGTLSMTVVPQEDPDTDNFVCPPPPPADCRDPSPPINGSLLSFNSTLEGSMVVFRCDEGFLPERNIAGICARNGNWTPDPATFNCMELTPGTDTTEPDSATGSELSAGVIAAVVIVLVIVAATAGVIAVVLGVLYLKKYRRKYNPSQPQPIASNGSDHDVEMYSMMKGDNLDSKPTHLAGVSYDEVNLDSRGGPLPKVAVSSYIAVNPGSGGVAPPKTDPVQYSAILTSETAKLQEPVHPADKKLNIDSVLIQLREVYDYWQQLGEALGVPTSVLDDVSQLCTTPKDSMVEVIDFWLRSHTGQPTWKEVADALREVNLTHLSRSIRQVYTTGTLPVVVDERAPLPLPNRKEDTPPPIPARGGDSPEMPNPPAVPVRSGDSPEMPRPPPKPTRGHRTRQRPPVPPKSGGLTTSDPKRRAPPRPPKQPPSEEAPPPRPPKKMAPSVVAAPPIPPKPTLK